MQTRRYSMFGYVVFCSKRTDYGRSALEAKLPLGNAGVDACAGDGDHSVRLAGIGAPKLLEYCRGDAEIVRLRNRNTRIAPGHEPALKCGQWPDAGCVSVLRARVP